MKYDLDKEAIKFANRIKDNQLDIEGIKILFKLAILKYKNKTK